MTWTGPLADRPPQDMADHAQDFARRYAFPLDAYCALRMQELGIPEDLQGADDLRKGMKWCAFDPEGREGGQISKGITVNSGVLNLELLRGSSGSRLWARSRLRDRIDAVIAHEFEESRTREHRAALRAAAVTELPITAGARQITRAMARSFPSG
ncbi:MAG: hypothetical protein U0835_06295 [Isosphaeraceae bacterium]